MPRSTDSGSARRLTSAKYHVLTPQAGTGFGTNSTLRPISIRGGRVSIGADAIQDATVQDQRVAWTQSSPTGFTSGLLFQSKDGLNIHGAVAQGSTAQDAVRQDVAGTAVQAVRYATRITKSFYAPGTDPSSVPAGDWQVGLPLEVTYEVGLGGGLPQPKVTLGDQDVSSRVAWSLASTSDPDAMSNTVLTINLDAMTCSFSQQLYKTAQLTFDVDAPVPSGLGSVSALCSDAAPSADGRVRIWQATATA